MELLNLVCQPTASYIDPSTTTILISSISGIVIDTDVVMKELTDNIEYTEKLIKRYNLPVYVVGHSYGSFIAQRYAQVCNLSNKIVLCGSAYTKTAEMFFGYVFSLLTALFKGNHVKAKMIEHFSFDGYEKKFEKDNWLPQDEEVFKKYKLDPYCGTMFPVCF